MKFLDKGKFKYMKYLFLLFIAFSVSIASAQMSQMYKRIGPNGEVYFSDQPGPDAEEIELSPVNVKPAETLEVDKVSPAQKEEALTYTNFSIVSPMDADAIRANDGNITIQLSLQPALLPDHTINLILNSENGKQIKTSKSLTIELLNMSRGLYTIQASIVDESGKELIRTKENSFHLLRVAAGN